MRSFDEIYEEMKKNGGHLLVPEIDLPSEILDNDSYSIRAQKNKEGISYYDIQQSFKDVKEQKDGVDNYQQRIIKPLIKGKSLSILDAGTATGIEFKKFIETTNKYATIESAVAIDLSQGMVDEAKKNLEGIAKVYKKDMTDTSFEKESFDLIRIAHGTLGHLPNSSIQKGLKHFYDLLKPKGILLFDVMTKEIGIFYEMSKGMEDAPTHSVYFTPTECIKNNYVNPLRPNMSKKESPDNRFIVNSVRLFLNNDITNVLNKIGFKDTQFEYISWDPNNSTENSVFNTAYVIKK